MPLRVDYDRSPNASLEQKFLTLMDSINRAMESLEDEMSKQALSVDLSGIDIGSIGGGGGDGEVAEHTHLVKDVRDVTPLSDTQLDAMCGFDDLFDGDIIPVATPYALGCVAVGDGIDVDENGVISAGSYFQDSVPIGSIVEWGSEIIPENWLLLNGQAVSRTGYAELFALYGTKYGEGDGSTTFNLPDYRKRVPVGMDETDADFDELGNTGGEKTHKLTTNEMPKHKHLIYQDTNGKGSRNAIVTNYGVTGGTRIAMLANSGVSDFGPDSGDNAQGLVNADYAGGDQPHNNLQPYIVTNFIVKAKLYTARLLPDGMIVDSLTSNSSTDALSAAKGKELNEMVTALMPTFLQSKDHGGAVKLGKLGIEWGYEQPSIAANSGTDVTVLFANTYKRKPVVNCTTTENTSYFNLFPCGIKGVTITGATLRVQNTYSVADTIGLMWIAIGEVT